MSSVADYRRNASERHQLMNRLQICHLPNSTVLSPSSWQLTIWRFGPAATAMMKFVCKKLPKIYIESNNNEPLKMRLLLFIYNKIQQNTML